MLHLIANDERIASTTFNNIDLYFTYLSFSKLIQVLNNLPNAYKLIDRFQAYLTILSLVTKGFHSWQKCYVLRKKNDFNLFFPSYTFTTISKVYRLYWKCTVCCA